MVYTGLNRRDTLGYEWSLTHCCHLGYEWSLSRFCIYVYISTVKFFV
jgi:hypothetical protein